MSFGLIALVFMISYGIVRGALLSPKDELFNVIAIPYWQFYGELFLEDDGRCKFVFFFPIFYVVYLENKGIVIKSLHVSVV